MREERNACRILVGKTEEKRQLGKLRRMWVNNIKVDLIETGWGGVKWTSLILLLTWIRGGLLRKR
jgi:hypothetical protein